MKPSKINIDDGIRKGCLWTQRWLCINPIILKLIEKFGVDLFEEENIDNQGQILKDYFCPICSCCLLSRVLDVVKETQIQKLKSNIVIPGGPGMAGI